MSLLIHCPFTEDWRNIGLTNTQLSSSNASIVNDGKIGGKCLQITGTGTYVSYPQLENKRVWSVAVWARIDSTTDYAQWADIFSLETKADSQYGTYTGQCRIERSNSSNPNTWGWYITTYYSAASTTASFSPGSKSGNTAGAWHHLTITFDGTKGTSYYDGAYLNSANLPTAITNLYLTGRAKVGDGNLKASINDLRIYDHCLSEKEVKELSKGLMLHYPLNEQPIKANLFTNMIYTYDNPFIAKNTKDSGEQTWITDTKVSLQTGKTYTISWKTDSTKSGTSQCEVFLLKDKAYTSYIGSSRLLRDGSQSFTLANSVGTVNNPGDYYIRVDNNTPQTTVKYWDFKIEENDKPSTFVSSGEAQPISDCSGYCNNGIITGNLTTSTGTPRYDKYTTNFGSNYIVTPNIYWGLQYSLSFWLKRDFVSDALDSSSYILHSGSPIYIYQAANAKRLRARIYYTAADGTSTYVNLYLHANQTDHTWHHYVVSVDDKTLKSYMDGTLYSTVNIPEDGTRILESKAKSLGRTDTLLTGLSDFRMYATALSADDVKELYNSSASLDKNGNLLTYQLIES